jgi:RNA polymerase sigma factor (sigma-70 family)
VAIRPNGAMRRQLRTLFNLGVIGELTDGQLLERFATRGGEAAELAFAALVERHGPMVLRVCRNTLRDPNDVHDAFQATFLVLVQKARALWVRDSLGPWLHRVAHRVATRARSTAARRRKHERRAAETRPNSASGGNDWDGQMAILHEEIERLPERCRVPVVLCDLQGLTHEQAARHLGWPVGTVKSRLERARELLRGRLSRRGVGLPTGLLITEKGLGAAFRVGEVVVQSTLVESTVRAAAPFAAGEAQAVGVISSRVAILIEEVLTTMFLTKLKLAWVVVLLTGVAGAAGVLAQQGARSNASPAAHQPQWPAAAESRRATGVDSALAPAPAYITQSRAMIITRLEEEVAEARARLDRTHRQVLSPDDPALVRARKTFEDLQQRLDRIDRVFVDVVETYPTMFDFSGGPSDFASSDQPAAGPIRKTQGAGNRQGIEPLNEADRARGKDRAERPKRKFNEGYPGENAQFWDTKIGNSGKQNGDPASKPNPGGRQDPSSAEKTGESQKNTTNDNTPNGSSNPAVGSDKTGTQGQGTDLSATAKTDDARNSKRNGDADNRKGDLSTRNSNDGAKGAGNDPNSSPRAGDPRNDQKNGDAANQKGYSSTRNSKDRAKGEGNDPNSSNKNGGPQNASRGGDGNKQNGDPSSEMNKDAAKGHGNAPASSPKASDPQKINKKGQTSTPKGNSGMDDPDSRNGSGQGKNQPRNQNQSADRSNRAQDQAN